MAQHVLPSRTYYSVFAALVVLTFLTVAISFVHLGAWHSVVGLTIATCKALLVILFFMHVLYSSRVSWLIILASIYWLGIMIGLTLTDYWSRWKLVF
jgi:cytochrome c oxidase subunit 4